MLRCRVERKEHNDRLVARSSVRYLPNAIMVPVARYLFHVPNLSMTPYKAYEQRHKLQFQSSRSMFRHLYEAVSSYCFLVTGHIQRHLPLVAVLCLNAFTDLNRFLYCKTYPTLSLITWIQMQPHRCHYGACPECQLPCMAPLPCGHSCKERYVSWLAYLIF